MSDIDTRKEFEVLRNTLNSALPKECGNCGSIENLQIHHVVPLSFGGSNRISNLVRLCNACHSKAHGGYSLIEKASETRRKGIANGGRIGSKILFGYKYENNEYTIDEASAEVVRFIFRLRYDSELSTSNIAELLNHLAIPTAGSGNEWKHPTIARMLKNPQYLGRCVYVGDVLGDNVFPAIIIGELAESIPLFERKYEGKRVPIRIFPNLKTRST